MGQEQEGDIAVGGWRCCRREEIICDLTVLRIAFTLFCLFLHVYRFRVIAGETWVDSLNQTTEEGELNMPVKSPPLQSLSFSVFPTAVP